MTYVNSKYPSQCSYRGKLFVKTPCATNKGIKHEIFYRCALNDETIYCKRRIKASTGDAFCFAKEEEENETKKKR